MPKMRDEMKNRLSQNNGKESGQQTIEGSKLFEQLKDC